MCAEVTKYGYLLHKGFNVFSFQLECHKVGLSLYLALMEATFMWNFVY